MKNEIINISETQFELIKLKAIIMKHFLLN